MVAISPVWLAPVKGITTFLECLFEPTDLVEIRLLPSRRSLFRTAERVPDLDGELVAANEHGQHVFIGVNPRLREGGKAQDVALARALFADIDRCDVEVARQRIVDSGLPEPTCTAASGHGLHAYWVLTKPMTDLAAWTAAQKRLIALLGSDKAIHDPPRIMRLPTTVNHKAPPALCEVIDADPSRRYALDELLAVCPPGNLEHLAASPTPAGDRPGDRLTPDDVRAVLQRHGWTPIGPGSGGEHWRRPGKSEGTSATLREDGVFYNFSDNATPFKPNEAYSPFAVFALLEHAGDFSAAARALSTPKPTGIADRQTSAGRTLAFRYAIDVVPEQITWLWPARIPQGKLSLMVGDPGQGKSLATIDIAVRVASGLSWPDIPLLSNPPGRVILFSAEDDLADTVRPRLDAALSTLTDAQGARRALSNIILMEAMRELNPLTGVKESPFNLTQDLEHLDQLLQRIQNVRLVVFDPLSGYLGSRLDAHRDTEVRSALAPLATLAAKHRTTIIAVMHLRKSQTETPAIHRTLGSVAFTAAARSVWLVGKDPNDRHRRVMLPVKCNLAPDSGNGLSFRIEAVAKVPHVIWDSEPVTMLADDAIAAPQQRQGRPPAVRAAAEDWLRAALSGGPRPAKDLLEEGREEAGHTRWTLDRARQAVGVVAYRPVNPGPWWWRLPEQPELPQGGGPEDDRGTTAESRTRGIMRFCPGAIENPVSGGGPGAQPQNPTC
ncbi:MAG TPA: AAA family ATPase [Phycisphaerae bacterium]|nr:AAA family ATPase [Phycisphaerae bacterium]HNU44411.1 AAA family ATPase [Phycisphaerae bacterium]